MYINEFAQDRTVGAAYKDRSYLVTSEVNLSGIYFDTFLQCAQLKKHQLDFS